MACRRTTGRTAVRQPPSGVRERGWDTAPPRVGVRRDARRCVSHLPASGNVAATPLNRVSAYDAPAGGASGRFYGARTCLTHRRSDVGDQLLELGAVGEVVEVDGATRTDVVEG